MEKKFEEIVSTATLAVCVFDNLQTHQFELWKFPVPVPVPGLANGTLKFVGVVGIVEGAVRTALAEPLEDAQISTISAAFIRGVEDAIEAAEQNLKQNDGGVGWLERLYALPDTRD